MSGDGYESTIGFMFCNKKNKEYIILLQKLKNADKCREIYTFTMLHELFHVETFPTATADRLIKYGKKKKEAIWGYEFWKEYIAEWMCTHYYEEHFDKVSYLHDKVMSKKYIQNRQGDKDSLYELIICSEITGIYPKGTETQTKELIHILQQIKERNKDSIADISLKEFQQIGLAAQKILDKEKEDSKSCSCNSELA